MLLVINLTMNLWNINKLKDDLSNKKVNQRDLLIYYLLNGVFLAIIILPSFSIYFFYKEDNYQWIDWFFTNAIYLITIFLSFKANKGSSGNNFIERVLSVEMILLIRYFVFFSIPYEIFHLAFLEETAYSDIGNLISSITLGLILSIRTIQCMNDIQKI